MAGPGEGTDPTPEFPGPAVTQAGPGELISTSNLPKQVQGIVGPGDKVYVHPQGAAIVVTPNGSVLKYGPDGKPRKTSATAAKLAIGHGQWEPVTARTAKPEPKIGAPPMEKQPLSDFTPAQAVVVAPPEVELPSKPAPAGSKFHAPMTFNEVEVAEVPKYIADDAFYFQQKVDGIRGQLVIEPGKEPWFRSKSGNRLASTTAANITKPILKKIGPQANAEGPSYAVDGELLNGVWYVFDVTVEGGEKVPWEDRMKTAEAWVKEMHKAGIMSIQALPTARTSAEKQALWDAVNASGGEGVMIKRRDAPYNYDRRVSHTVKAKITATADVIVLERNRDGKENAVIGVVIDGKVTEIGTVSMQGKEKFKPVKVGDVVEVEYLWAMPGTNSLQQPRFKKIRTDKTPAEATVDQFRYVDKSIVDIDATPAATFGSDTQVPDSVGAVLDKWVKLGGSASLTDGERHEVEAAVVTHGEKPPSVLYRGLSAKPPAGLAPGRPIDTGGPVSTSEEEGSALPYAEADPDVGMMLVFEGMPKGLNVQGRAEKQEGYGEAEWITAGRTYVKSVSIEDGMTYVTVAPNPGTDKTAQTNATKPPLTLHNERLAPAPAPESPPPTPEAAKDPFPTVNEPTKADPLDAAIAALPTTMSIEGDPRGASFTVVRVDSQGVRTDVVVTRGEDGSLTYQSKGGGTLSLSQWMPELWKAASAAGGEGRSYDAVIDKTAVYWSGNQKDDFAVDNNLPSPPRRPYAYNGKVSNKDQRAFMDAEILWNREVTETLKRGGPKTVPVRIDDPQPATGPALEAELKRLGSLAQIAHAADAAVTDKSSSGTLTALDQYLSAKSRLEVSQISEAAAPLRAEVLRRLRSEAVPGQMDGFDSQRWTETKKPATSAASNPLPPEEQTKARSTYVVKDKNTIDKNASLRGSSPTPAAKTWRGKTDRWIRSNKAAHDMVLHRGIAVPASIVRSFRPGAVVTDPGVISTDADEGGAGFYLGIRLKSRPDAAAVMLEVLTPAGTPVVDADYGEFVFPSGTNMLIRRVRVDEDGTYHVTVEVGTAADAAANASGGGAQDGVGGGPAGVTAAGLRVRVAGGAR